MARTFWGLFFEILRTPQGLGPSECSYKKTCICFIERKNEQTHVFRQIWLNNIIVREEKCSLCNSQIELIVGITLQMK